MGFQIRGLDPKPFRALFDLSDAELKARGMRRHRADSKPGYPCRASLEDAEVGEELLLLNYAHHEVNSPYAGNGPIYVRRQATEAATYDNRLPPVLVHRLLSVRAYDAAGMMRDSEVLQGSDLPATIERFFADPKVGYLHVHNAKPGCFACAVVRG
ncbi:MAG: DUF1203 domain-containing protein [Myxococcaceae bacterium]